MEFDLGSTRAALLIGNRAIKISRINIFRPILQAFKMCLPVHADWRENRMAKYSAGRSVVQALREYLISSVIPGFRASRQEYRLSRTHPEQPLAYVHGIYLWGFVLVMERGTPVPAFASEILRSRVREHGGDCDLDQPKHVCAFVDGLRFIDYGHPDAPRLLGIA